MRGPRAAPLFAGTAVKSAQGQEAWGGEGWAQLGTTAAIKSASLLFTPRLEWELERQPSPGDEWKKATSTTQRRATFHTV